MRLVFNLRLLRSGKIGGLENVARWMAAGLAADPLAADQRLIALCPASERQAVEAMCPWHDIVAVAPDEPEPRMARAVRRARPDLLLCPLLTLEPADPPCPAAVYLPDLQHESFPEFFAPDVLAWRRKAYALTVRRADLILTTSPYARGTILARYPEADPARVIAAICGVDPVFDTAQAGDETTPARLGLPEHYLLYPANFWPHKNHRRLLTAIAKLREAAEPPFVALTGAPSSGLAAVEAEISRLGLADHVVCLGRVPLPDLAAVMRHARAVVFPSLYEGFGLPILEAFHTGAPVLCSNATGCPEVAGDAALLVDPTSVDAIAAGIHRIWTDDALRADLAARGNLRRHEFSSDRTFRNLRSALLAIATAPKPRLGPFTRLMRAVRPASLEP